MMGDLTEDLDQFFDTREEIVSLSDSNSDVGEKSDLESVVGSSELLSSFGYDVWVKSPGTIFERRHRLFKLMGLSADWAEKEDPASNLDGAVGIDTSRITEDCGAVLRSSYHDMQFSDQDLESCCSTSSSQPFGEVLNENLVCSIRNLDNGTVFIVDELGQDGLLRRLREVGSDRVVTDQEFERILGLSPLVQQVMRKDAGQAPLSSVVKRQTKKGWLRRLGAIAGVANAQIRLSNAKADGCRSFRITRDGNQSVKVRTLRKRSKELSALHVSQDMKAHDGAILTMKFSPDGQLLASAGEDGVVRVWQVTKTQRSNSFHISDTKSPNIYFMINDLGELVALNVSKEKRSKMKGLGKSSDSACVIFPESVFHLAEKPLHEFHGHRGEVLDLSWSKDKYLLSSSIDKTVHLWRVGFDRCQKVFSHNDYVTCVHFNPVDENCFISGSIDGKIRIWAINECEVVDWTDVKGIVTALSYQPDGKGAVVGSMAGDCIFFDTSDNRLQLINHTCLQGKKKSSPLRRITGLQFSPVDPSKLMVTSADSHVRVLQGGNVICKYRGIRNGGSQISASFTADGAHIVSASEDSNVYMWDHVAPDRPGSSHVKSTWSYEHFLSNNASVAIPWNGTLSGSSVFSGLMGPTGIVVKYRTEPEKPCNRFPLFSPDALSLGFSEPPFSRGSATWPEEKLADQSGSLVLSSSSACKSEYKFVKTTCQNMTGSHHAWGSVIVTASLDGKIRVFENYGLPVPV